MFMSADPEKQPAMPLHDFAEKKLFITPAAHRFIRKVGTGQFLDGELHNTICRLVCIFTNYYVNFSISMWIYIIDFFHEKYMYLNS